MGLVRSRMRLITYVSSSPVIMYLRGIVRAILRGVVCVCEGGDAALVKGGGLTRSMCKPHVHPSAFWGVLWIWMMGVSCRRRGGVISSSVYHWRSVSCIMIIAGGWSKVKVVIVVVSVVVCDKGCKVGVVVYVKDGCRVK
jgi:hypothetical protein